LKGELLNIDESIKISCLDKLESVCQEWHPDAIFSFVDPGTNLSSYLTYAPKWHYKYSYFDQEESGDNDVIGPKVRKFLQDARFLASAGAQRILFHCHAGVSRSTACAYIYLHQHCSNADAGHPFENLMRISRKPWPNLKICELADSFLGESGSMIRPLLEYREEHPSRINVYRRLNRRRGLISPVPR
jgi:predicted protein tyrosine phosphatase